MKLISRRQPTAVEIAAAAEAEDRRRRLAAQFARDQAAADREEQRRAAREAARAEKRRRKAQAKARARRRARALALLGTARTVGPLLLVNGAAVGGQLAYAYDQTPAEWNPAARVAVAIGVAAAAESVALYVGWHAHDALLAGARTTAARLRRASYAIAAVMAVVNYSHFADSLTDPTALAVILGVLSSLSPWLWGLHTRRAQHVQLLRDELVDATGAIFDPARRRAFPIRSLMARRWSIDHHVRDPRAAWEGYRQHRTERRAARPSGRLRAAWAALLGRTGQPAPATPATSAAPAQPDEPDRQCTDLLEQMAAARARISSGAAWAVRRWTGLAPATPRRAAEPAGIDRPAPAHSLASAAEPAAQPAEPEPAPRPAQLPIPGVPADLVEPAEVDPAEPGRASRGPGRPVDGARLAREYDRLSRALRRPPSGSQLAEAAGCGRSTAKEWMRKNRPRAAA
ncbi:hypothetical protein [Micromonospora sp. NPDC023633]|uniref:hypothetical protein n=1 Tax=Micromonospora sp. NPDC023633 TaxID=3154320 RepID=UPI003409DA35